MSVSTKTTKYFDLENSTANSNIRCANNNFENFKILLTELNFEFKAICLTAIWCVASTDMERQCKFNSDRIVHQTRSHGTAGIICIFLHNFLLYKVRPNPVNNEDNEALCIGMMNKNN